MNVDACRIRVNDLCVHVGSVCVVMQHCVTLCDAAFVHVGACLCSVDTTFVCACRIRVKRYERNRSL